MVEDNERVRRLNVRRLPQLEHQTVEAADGPTALLAFDTEERIDVPFTDMIMPNGLSGLALAGVLRKRCSALPVLIATGSSEQLLTKDSLVEDASVLLGKPYDNEALISAIEDA